MWKQREGTRHLSYEVSSAMRRQTTTQGAEMEFKDLTSDQQEKARNCKSAEELIDLAKQEGYELSDDELSAIAGGSMWTCNDQSCSHYDPEPHSR